jgi:AcrR family transcriptional regulator
VPTSSKPGAASTADAATVIDRRRAPATREAILRATLVLVAEEGLGSLSNRRVAAEAGVSLGSLTYHFPSQAELLRESLLLYVGEEVERLEALAAALRTRDPGLEEVVGEVEALIARPTGGPGPLAELELYLQAARDPELQEASRRCLAAYDALAADALAALGVPDPTRHSAGVVALITGLGLRRLGTGAADSEAVTDALLTFLRGALADASVQL